MARACRTAVTLYPRPMRTAPEVPSPRGGAGDRSFAIGVGPFNRLGHDGGRGKARQGSVGIGEPVLRYYPAEIKTCIR